MATFNIYQSLGGVVETEDRVESKTRMRSGLRKEEKKNEDVINIKKVNSSAGITHGTEYSAGYDIINYKEIRIRPQQVCVVDCGFYIQFPTTYCALIMSRSSTEIIGLKVYTGLIDPDFSSIPWILYKNTSDKDIVLRKNQCYAQLLFLPRISMDVKYVDNLEFKHNHNGR